MIGGGKRQNYWQIARVISATALTGLGVAATFDVWADITHIAYQDEEASHIFLVPIVCVWLLWVRRDRMRRWRPIGLWAGPVSVAFGWLIGMGGYHNSIQIFWHAGAILIVLGCLVSIVGTDVLKRFSPLLIAIAFLIPVPGMVRQQIAIPLQAMTVNVTHAIFQVLDIPVARSGHVLCLNGVEVGIAEACNGMRMIFALVLVSYAYAFGKPFRWQARTVILAVSPLLAIFCNVLRLIPTIFLYGYVDVSHADLFHTMSGWASLIVAFLLLMGMVGLMRWTSLPLMRYTLAHD